MDHQLRAQQMREAPTFLPMSSHCRLSELTFHPIESEHNEAGVIDGAGRVFKWRTLT